MQTRHRHFIRPVTRVAYPTCIVAVECLTSSETELDHSGTTVESLAGWQTSTATLKQGIAQKIFHECGSTADDFWHYIVSVLHCFNAVTIVSWQAWIDSILLGFWERLEDGRIYLTGVDPRSAVSSERRNRGSQRGYWVLENPPTILKFKLQSQQGSLTWLDMRNFGLSRSIQSTEPFQSPEHTLTTLIDVIDFLRENNLGGLCHTTASQSLSSFKYRFLKHSIHVNTNETANLLGSASLHGGRNECYRLGQIQGPVTQYDFNSLYPSVYVREALPIRVRDIRLNPTNSECAAAIKAKNCICRIMVYTDIPCLPVKRRGNLIFPVGRFWTVVPWPELELALELCNHVKIETLGTYDLDYALREYGQTLYDARIRAKQDGRHAIAAYAKALLVSLPGKFGQRNRRWQFNGRRKYENPWSVWYAKNSQGKYSRHRSVATYCEEEIDAGLGYEAVPEIAAWVNSWGRRALWEEMCHVGRERIVYVDTDSLWVSGQDSSATAIPIGKLESGLGKIRCVDTYKQVEFAGLKHYAADGIATPANRGFRISQRSVATGGDSGHYGVAWHCHRGIPPRIPVSFNAESKCGEYTHGKVMPDLSVRPLELDEW